MLCAIYRVWLEALTHTAWSAPSAIGSAGLGVGVQTGAEMTDFLVVLNSKSVRSASPSIPSLIIFLITGSGML